MQPYINFSQLFINNTVDTTSRITMLKLKQVSLANNLTLISVEAKITFIYTRNHKGPNTIYNS